MPEITEFSNNLKNLRNIKGFTQQNVADCLGIKRTTYTKWETGVAEPSFKYIKMLVKLFEVDYNFLFMRGDINEYQYQGKELKIMELLWQQNSAMTISEMVNLCSGTVGEKINYIRLLVNNLCEKGILKCIGSKKLTKNYAAIYIPALTKAEYFLEVFRPSEKDALQIVEVLINTYDFDDNFIVEIKKLLTR